jgi:feruloyl esterase
MTHAATQRSVRIAGLLGYLASTAWAAPTCEGLAKVALTNTSISLAESTPAGTFTPPSGKPIPNLPAFCRVAGVIKPSADSNIQFEVWMPATGWNGKFQGIGNGGFAGAISFSGMAAALARGYATASTDTGHQGGGTDATWALGHREKVIDFGYRAIHETAEKAKALIRGFYGDGPKRSYFHSCSNGGRQALMEAQRFPGDYDGIIAGAPANDWTHLLSSAVWQMQATLAEPGSYIPAAKLQAIQAAVLVACDSLDQVKDGVIESPAQCRFDPATLLCKGAESDSCLTTPQVAALKKLYDGPRNSEGKPIFPGYSPGGEAEPGGWAPWITGSEREKSLLFAFGTQFFKNIVYENAAWDFRTFQLHRDLSAANEKVGRFLSAVDPDLKHFKERGGKLIIYHGWSDAAIPAQSAINYYQSVLKKMGSKDANTFVRLFMVPGMQHCGGGSGPNSIGQAPGVEGDALRDIDAAMERWVEQGVAPQQIIATKYKTGADPASGVDRTRPLCPFPQVARWKGSGGTNDAGNFTCAQAAPAGSN